jgi:hypothetical protein
MHVEQQWVNKLMFFLLVKDKRGEPPKTLRLTTLVKRVVELREAELKSCHYTEEFTLRWIHPLGHREKLAFEYPWLGDLNREPANGKMFILHVLPVTIYYSDLIHSFFYSTLTKIKIDQLVGYLFDKDPPVPRLNSVPAPAPDCAENPPPLVRTITFFILYLIYDWYIWLLVNIESLPQSSGWCWTIR